MQVDPRQYFAILPSAFQRALFLIPDRLCGAQKGHRNCVILLGCVAIADRTVLLVDRLIARTIWIMTHLGSRECGGVARGKYNADAGRQQATWKVRGRIVIYQATFDLDKANSSEVLEPRSRRPTRSGPGLPWLCPRANHWHRFFQLDHAPDFVHTRFTSHPASQPASVKLMFACQLCSGTADFPTSLFSIKI